MYIIENDGKRRKAQYYKCETCSKEFIARKNRPRRFCSLKCRTIENKEPNVICANCSKRFYKNTSGKKKSKSGLFFCCRKCKDNAQCIGGIKEIMPPHYGTSKDKDYRKNFLEKDLICARCGYNEFPCGVEIHHIDENRENNNKNNLIPLCSCCHRALHNKFWNLKDLF